MAALRKKTVEVLDGLAASDPTTKKVHESFMSFKKKHDAWKNLGNASNAFFDIRSSVVVDGSCQPVV